MGQRKGYDFAGGRGSEATPNVAMTILANIDTTASKCKEFDTGR